VLADDHNYQVTGPVLAVTGTSITVKKGKIRGTVSRDASTVVTGDVKVGSKVTIKYHMVADTVVGQVIVASFLQQNGSIGPA